MKADKERRLTIPGIYLKNASIRDADKIVIIKSKEYGRFYLDSENRSTDVWCVTARIKYNKLYLPKVLHSEKADYRFGIEDGRLYMLRTA